MLHFFEVLKHFIPKWIGWDVMLLCHPIMIGFSEDVASLQTAPKPFQPILKHDQLSYTGLYHQN